MNWGKWIHDSNKENGAFFYNQISVNTFVAKQGSSNILHFAQFREVAD